MRAATASLFERDAVLEAIDGALEAAGNGQGSLVVLGGAAGLGKSSLLGYARSQAPSHGLTALWAQGAELERDFTCGVALQLFGRPLASLGAEQAQAILSPLPAAVAALLRPNHGYGAVDPVALEQAGTLAIAHGLFSLAGELAESRPLALIVDDAQWADAPSLRFLAYLCARLDELPTAVLVAHRPGEGAEAEPILSDISATPGAAVRTLAPLGADSVVEMVRQELSPTATEQLGATVAALTGGNPFYIHELVSSARRDGTPVHELSAQELSELTPDSISRAIRARAARLPHGAAQLAEAVAVLGPGGDLELASALAGLGLDAAARARSALVTAQILSASDALAFLHPLVGQAIAAELPVHTRAVAHLRAAQLLADRHAEPERIAMHLLGATRSGDAWTVDILRAAARQAGGHGGTESELRYLERALEEPPAPELRPDVLVELGRTEVAAGRAGADARFAAALALTADPARRAEIGQELGRALYVRGSHREAAEAFDAALAELQAAPDAERESELQAGYVAAATIDPDLRADALARADALVGHLARPRNAGERAILAQAALHRTLAGEPRPTVRELAVRAWDDGALLADETAAGFNWTLVTGAFDFTDELELALEVCQAAMADARRLGSPLAFATASYERCIPLYHMGRIAEASADAQAAVDATRYGWEMYARSAAYTLSLCQIERDDLEAAERTLEILDREPAGSSIEHPALLDARAILRRRQGRHEESLAAHLEAGRLFTEVFGVMTTGDVAWRLGAAEAALALGDAQRAGSLAEEELEFSQRVGLTRGIVGALRVLGLAQGGRAGLQSLERAVNHPEPAPSRLEHLRALIDFGSALRRANQRADAREVLEAAVRRTGERGATALATRARRELEATGARSRSDLRHGMDAVTPSELRVAELAAQGHTNREIALALFVTTKTVEYHLRQVFQKLDISSRRELPEALGQRVAA